MSDRSFTEEIHITFLDNIIKNRLAVRINPNQTIARHGELGEPEGMKLLLLFFRYRSSQKRKHILRKDLILRKLPICVAKGHIFSRGLATRMHGDGQKVPLTLNTRGCAWFYTTDMKAGHHTHAARTVHYPCIQTLRACVYFTLSLSICFRIGAWTHTTGSIACGHNYVHMF